MYLRKYAKKHGIKNKHNNPINELESHLHQFEIGIIYAYICIYLGWYMYPKQNNLILLIFWN